MGISGQSLAAFEKDLKNFVEAMDDEIVQTRHILTKETLERLADMSPVLTGTYVYNHKVSVGGSGMMSVMYLPRTPGDQDPDARMQKKAALGAEMVVRELLKLLGTKGEGKIVIDNNVPYADAVEFGISPYAPEGVYRLTEAHVESIADQLLSKIPQRVF